MLRRKTTEKGMKRMKYFNRIALAAIAALAIGLWTPRMASALLIAEIEPNDTGATAQNVNGSFSLDFDANITLNNNPTFTNTSTTIPHVSIRATGDGTFDFYRFSSLGGRIILDIDATPAAAGGGDLAGNRDTEIGIWDAAGNFIDFNDDSAPADPGSPSVLNSFLDLLGQPAGDYIVGVCRFSCTFAGGFSISGLALTSAGFYTLHISTEPAAVPEPSAVILLGSGLAGLGAFSRRRSTKKNDA